VPILWVKVLCSPFLDHVWHSLSNGSPYTPRIDRAGTHQAWREERWCSGTIDRTRSLQREWLAGLGCLDLIIWSLTDQGSQIYRYVMISNDSNVVYVNVYVNVYVYIYISPFIYNIYTYLYPYIYIYIYINIFISIYIYIHLYTYIPIYLSIYLSIYVCMYVCRYVGM